MMIKIILGVALVAALIFILVLTANAILSGTKSRKLGKALEHKTVEEQLEYAQRLSRMIKCETVSSENEYDDTEFGKLRNVMEELFPLVHKYCERKIFSNDCWLYKLTGKNEKRNIMIMSHHDVVSASGEWEHPPFCGEVFEDALWGRGTVDTKTSLFAEFQALEELLAEGFMPECNIYIGSSHNEETGGDGIPQVLTYFKEKGIELELVLDEGGAIIDPPLAGIKSKCAMVAVHEKGRHRIICTASEGNTHTGLAGNSNTPVARMSGFINEVNSSGVFITRLHPQVKAMFEALCPYTPFVMRLLFSNLWCFGTLLKTVMPKINPQAGAMVGTGCSFNFIEGSYETKKCVARAMLRPIDKKDFEKDLESIYKIAEKYGVTIQDGEGNELPRSADMESSAYKYTMDCINRIFPEVITAPYILPAGTDARHLCEICPCVLRFAPIEMNSQQFASVHSENENISLKAIGNAVVFYKYFLGNY